MTSPERTWAALLPSDRDWLVRACHARGIPPRTWHRVPSLSLEAEVLAVETLADRLEGEAGSSRTGAVEAACHRLGIPYDTHHRRIQRARKDAYDPERGAIGDESSLHLLAGVVQD